MLSDIHTTFKQIIGGSLSLTGTAVLAKRLVTIIGLAGLPADVAGWGHVMAAIGWWGIAEIMAVTLGAYLVWDSVKQRRRSREPAKLPPASVSEPALISLGDAARKVYEAADEKGVEGMSPKGDYLSTRAVGILVHAAMGEIDLYGRQPPSGIMTIVPLEHRKKLDFLRRDSEVEFYSI